MNLHAIASGFIGVLNPSRPLTVQVSTGTTQDDSYQLVPSYATPGAFTASIADDLLTVTGQSAGTLQIGQQLDATDILPGTVILEYGTGEGGTGTYLVSNSQTLASRAFTSELVVLGQVQPVGWRDIQMMDGLVLQGTRKKIWFFDRFDGLIRPDNKGGDLITDANGNVYLVAMSAEQWDERVWCSVFVTLQNGG